MCVISIEISVNHQKSLIFHWTLRVFFSTEHLPQPNIKGLTEQINVDRPTPVSCHIDYILTEDAKFTWSLSNKEIPSFTVNLMKYDNMAKYNSTLDHYFTREDHGKTITCSFFDMGNLRKYERSTAEVVDLLCKCIV